MKINLIIFSFRLAFIRLVENESGRFGLSSSFGKACYSCAMKEFLTTGFHNVADRVARLSQEKDIDTEADSVCFL